MEIHLLCCSLLWSSCRDPEPMISSYWRKLHKFNAMLVHKTIGRNSNNINNRPEYLFSWNGQDLRWGWLTMMVKKRLKSKFLSLYSIQRAIHFILLRNRKLWELSQILPMLNSFFVSVLQLCPGFLVTFLLYIGSCQTSYTITISYTIFLPFKISLLVYIIYTFQTYTTRTLKIFDQHYHENRRRNKMWIRYYSHVLFVR
jgi:hypothetical protein